MELYRMYRPQEYNQVVGQNTQVNRIRGYLQNKCLPHALLFTGSSGVGKTTLARITAKELGCNSQELIEVNSADFRGIDTVRDIRAQVQFRPMRGDVKVWIIDEIHMATKTAMEAMLKLLEEAPEWVYFMLCTTEPDKLIAPLKNRCTGIELSALTEKELFKYLLKFLQEHVPDNTLFEDELVAVAKKSNGSPRRALVIVEGLLQVPECDRKQYMAMVLEEETQSIVLCRALMQGKPWKDVQKILKDLKGDAEDIRRHILGYARAALLNPGASGKAFLVLDAFKDNFYDSGQAGVAWASYVVANGD